MKVFYVLVPKANTRAEFVIKRGSGVVTDDISRDRVLVHYEGNLYDSINMRSFEEKVHHAAGRLDQRYPTVAMGVWTREDFEVVGEYTTDDDWKHPRLEITRDSILQGWLA